MVTTSGNTKRRSVLSPMGPLIPTSIMSSTWCSMSAFHSTLARTIKMTARSGKNLLEFTWFVDNWYHYVIQSVLCISIVRSRSRSWRGTWPVVQWPVSTIPSQTVVSLHLTCGQPVHWNLIITTLSLGTADWTLEMGSTLIINNFTKYFKSLAPVEPLPTGSLLQFSNYQLECIFLKVVQQDRVRSLMFLL